MAVFGKYVKVFCSEMGDYYVYDTVSNRIFSVNKKKVSGFHENEIMEQIAPLTGANQIDKITWDNSFEAYHRKIETQIPKILIETTKRCNLDCRYCIYSGNYNHMTPHKDIDMSSYVLERCMDFFANHNTGCETAEIGFYGGEPFLDFDLIDRGIKYARKIISNKRLKFTISSNGLKMDSRIGLWLQHYPDVHLIVTVNGPYHDEYRRTLSGDGSYKIIQDNLLKMKQSYPDVWNKQIHLISNISHIEQLAGLAYFYRKIGKYPDSISNIAQENGNAVIKEIVSKLDDHEDTWKDLAVDYITSGNLIYDVYFGEGMRSLHGRKIYADRRGIIGGCFPFENKIFVQADGNLGICESVSNMFSLGSIAKGFDEDRIRYLYCAAEKLYNIKCCKCWAQRLCQICYRDIVAVDGTVINDIPNRICDKLQKDVLHRLKLFCDVVHYNPGLLMRRESDVISKNQN